MSKFPANLYRDDEVKTLLSDFIREQRTEIFNKVAAAVIDQDPLLKDNNYDDDEDEGKTAETLSARELNAVHISKPLLGAKMQADDDSFT